MIVGEVIASSKVKLKMRGRKKVQYLSLLDEASPRESLLDEIHSISGIVSYGLC